MQYMVSAALEMQLWIGKQHFFYGLHRSMFTYYILYLHRDDP